MRIARGIVLLGSAYALVGCGASSTEQVEAKVQQYAHATASRDITTLCKDVLAPDLVNHLTAAGLSCRQAMKVFVDSVQNPTISISKVHVNGSSASAVVLAQASGQRSSVETIRLIKSQHGWRLESLASPR
jgi:Holliday junction resolvasome RuvABC endonuclease subunit